MEWFKDAPAFFVAAFSPRREGGCFFEGEEECLEEEQLEEERVDVAPNMGVGGSYSQAISDPEEEKSTEGELQRKEGQHSEEKEEILRLLRRWRRSETSPS